MCVWGGGEKRYPIEPVVCTKCGHVQLKEMLDVEYKDYLYTASFSKGYRLYIESLVNDIDIMNSDRGGEKRIIEIGSSNGYFLKQMMQRGWEVLGFDPAGTLADQANADGVYTENMYFGNCDSIDIVERWGEPNVVVMRHVLEHLDDPNTMIEAISRVLKEGYAIIEVPYLAREVREEQFYAFYHEHVSYFSVAILQYLLGKHHFRITDIRENHLGGGSVIIYAYKGNGKKDEDTVVSKYLEEEQKWCSMEKLVAFSCEAEKQIAKISGLVEIERQRGNRIAVWGVGQRGVSLLNICELSNVELDYAIDVNENYWWKYVPGADIQIVPPTWLEDHFVETIIILSTGYADEIISENDEYIEKGGRFLKIIE